jgi:hypothetical protein
MRKRMWASASKGWRIWAAGRHQIASRVPAVKASGTRAPQAWPKYGTDKSVHAPTVREEVGLSSTALCHMRHPPKFMRLTSAMLKDASQRCVLPSGCSKGLAPVTTRTHAWPPLSSLLHPSGPLYGRFSLYFHSYTFAGISPAPEMLCSPQRDQQHRCHSEAPLTATAALRLPVSVLL